MFRLLAVALAAGQIHGLAVVPGALDLEAPPPLFVKTAGGDNSTAFERYERFNYTHWKPDNSLYEGVPMVEKQVIVNGEAVTYQDFDVTALTLDQFKQYFMSTPEFLNGNGELSHSDEEAQKYLDSLIAAEKDANATTALPRHHVDKRAFPDGCFYDDRLFCSSSCTSLVHRAVLQSTNKDVYGYYHYQSGSLCGTGSISKSVSVTHVSGVSIGGSGQIPGFGKGWTKALSTFLTTFGLSISHSPDSVTTGITYSGTCGSFNVCYLWERPHFRVDKGVVVTQYLDANTKRTCKSPTQTPFENHVMHDNSDPGGATANGVCYSMNSHGCPSPVKASSTLPRCPNNF